MKSFKCPRCGFFISLAAPWEKLSEEEYRQVASCPCGEQMEEVQYSVDMIPTLNI